MVGIHIVDEFTGATEWPNRDGRFNLADSGAIRISKFKGVRNVARHHCLELEDCSLFRTRIRLVPVQVAVQQDTLQCSGFLCFTFSNIHSYLRCYFKIFNCK